MIKASFLSDLKFSSENVVITSLLESDFTKEIRIAFKQDQVMKEHKTKFPITVMVLQGCIEFTANEEMAVLNTGDMIALEGNVLHELNATLDSVVRLTLHKGDNVTRVSGVLKL